MGHFVNRDIAQMSLILTLDSKVLLCLTVCICRCETVTKVTQRVFDESMPPFYSAESHTFQPFMQLRPSFLTQIRKSNPF